MSDKRNRTTRTGKIGAKSTEVVFPSGRGACQTKPGTMPSANMKNVQGVVEGRSTTTPAPGGGLMKKMVRGKGE